MVPSFMTASGAKVSSITPVPQVARLSGRRSRIVRERLIEAVMMLAALVSVFTTLAIVTILIKESVVFFRQVSLLAFLTDTQWTPLFDDAHFGIMVLLSGTLVSSAVALSVAVPPNTVPSLRLVTCSSPSW